MFPKKFKKQLETTLPDTVVPDILWLTFSVCGVQEDSCGWEGWALESLKREGAYVEGDTDLKCPKCNLALFRTAASVRYIPSKDQKPDLVLGEDYEVAPTEYK